MERRLEGILLAAGESRRMGFPKPLLRLDGETFLTRSAASMLTVVEGLIIVVGAHREKVAAAVPADSRIRVIDNPAFKRGQLSSIKAGIRALPPAATAVMIHLVDHPLVSPLTFRALAGALAQPILIARYHGRRGHPVVFARPLFDELLGAPEDVGARAVVDVDPRRVGYVDVEDEGVLLDLDTPDDLRRTGLPEPER